MKLSMVIIATNLLRYLRYLNFSRKQNLNPILSQKSYKKCPESQPTWSEKSQSKILPVSCFCLAVRNIFNNWSVWRTLLRLILVHIQQIQCFICIRPMGWISFLFLVKNVPVFHNTLHVSLNPGEKSTALSKCSMNLLNSKSLSVGHKKSKSWFFNGFNCLN